MTGLAIRLALRARSFAGGLRRAAASLDRVADALDDGALDDGAPAPAQDPVTAEAAELLHREPPAARPDAPRPLEGSASARSRRAPL